MTENSVSRPPLDRHAGEAGFSLIEALIAALLLLFIVLGVLPLFSRAMMNNIQGNDASNIANGAIGSFEEHFTLDYRAEPLTVPVGSNVLETTDFWSLEHNDWLAAIDTAAGDQAQYTRTARLRQFSYRDIAEDGDFDTPLPGGADPANIQFKVVEVEIANQRMVGAPNFRVRALTSF